MDKEGKSIDIVSHDKVTTVSDVNDIDEDAIVDAKECKLCICVFILLVLVVGVFVVYFQLIGKPSTSTKRRPYGTTEPTYYYDIDYERLGPADPNITTTTTTTTSTTETGSGPKIITTPLFINSPNVTNATDTGLATTSNATLTTSASCEIDTGKPLSQSHSLL